MNYKDIQKMLAFNQMQLDVQSKVIKKIEDFVYEKDVVFCVYFKNHLDSPESWGYIAPIDTDLISIKKGDVLLVEASNDAGFRLCVAGERVACIKKEDHVKRQYPFFRVIENITRKYGTDQK